MISIAEDETITEIKATTEATIPEKKGEIEENHVMEATIVGKDKRLDLRESGNDIVKEVPKGKEVIVKEEEQVEKSLSALPLDDDSLILAKWYEHASHVKIGRKAKSEGDELESFFQDMVTDEEQGQWK